MTRLLLASTLLVLATSVGAQSQPTAATFRVTNQVGARIAVGATNLVVDDAGAGFYLIGSNDDTDDGNNVASFVRGNGSVMRAMNGAPTPWLPYAFTLTPDSADPSKLYFDVVVGPSSFNFTTVSLPLDGRLQLFDYWRHEGMSGLRRYDRNQYRYTPPGGGPVYIDFAPGSPTWGEMVGPDYSVRVRITSSSRPVSLAFVNAPSLSTGVRNVEFGFGPVRVGETARASGFIRVFRTDPLLFAMTPITYESELLPYHQIGRADGDGWSVRVGDTPNAYATYGPYVTHIPPGPRTAQFRVMLDNTTADNNRIVTLDVYDAAANRVLVAVALRRSQFTVGPFRYQTFELPFRATSGQRLEFRTYWHGGSYLKQNFVKVQ